MYTHEYRLGRRKARALPTVDDAFSAVAGRLAKFQKYSSVALVSKVVGAAVGANVGAVDGDGYPEVVGAVDGAVVGAVDGALVGAVCGANVKLSTA